MNEVRINVRVKRLLKEKVKSCFAKAGYETEAAFVRAAIREKLAKCDL